MAPSRDGCRRPCLREIAGAGSSVAGMGECPGGGGIRVIGQGDLALNDLGHQRPVEMMGLLVIPVDTAGDHALVRVLPKLVHAVAAPEAIDIAGEPLHAVGIPDLKGESNLLEDGAAAAVIPNNHGAGTDGRSSACPRR